jgi:plastocyanin
MAMSETTTIGRRLGAVLLAGALVFGLAACGDDDGGDDATADTDAAADQGPDYGGADDTAEDGGGGGTATEPVIADFTFSPDPIEISAGDTVTWTNEDDFAHTVTADDDSFDSDNIDGGGTFEQTFDEAGEFAYHCDIHNQMTGTVVVS